MIGDVVRSIVDGKAVSADQMYDAFAFMMDGQATDAQKAALLIALRMKGESYEELLGAARAMRERVTPIPTTQDVVDTCGTGGDGSGTFNVSTAAAIVAAAAGVPVAKHGNRAVSSSCGSADVLERLGVAVDVQPDGTATILERLGLAFLFAPMLHPAMAAVVGVRRELGVRTIFNLLGPLTNPARASRQVLGVYRSDVVRTMTRVLAAMGGVHVMVVHGTDGLDEISVSAPTTVCEWKNGSISERLIEPDDLGLRTWPAEQLRGGDVEVNAAMILDVLEGRDGAPRDIVLANSAAAIYVAGVASNLRQGVDIARSAIDSGAARRKLDDLIEATNAAREACA